jgi:branched-chain amino acid transport system permease protein
VSAEASVTGGEIATRRFPLSRRAVIVSLLLVAFAAIPPLLAESGILLGGVKGSSRALDLGFAVCYAMMALSLNVLLGYAGQISLGHGAFLGVGAFTSGLLTGQGPEVAFLVGIIAAAVVGALFAVIFGLPALRLKGIGLAIATISFAYLMEQSVFPRLTGFSAGVELPRPMAGTFVFTNNAHYLSILLIFLLGFWLFDQNLLRTKVGRAFQAIRSDERTAQAFGVSAGGYKLLAFVVSGALAAIAGALYGHLIQFVNSELFAYNAAKNFSLLMVVIVVIGGLGSRVGVAVAGILYAYIPLLLSGLIEWQLLIGAALLIYAMARHPGGFAQAFREPRERREEKRARAARDDEEVAKPHLPSFPRPKAARQGSNLAKGATLLAVEDVSVSFGGVQALDGASLAVPKGSIVGLIGPNGAGKTTLFNVISGFIRPNEGSVRYAGTEILGYRPHERVHLGIGRTFQLIGLAKDLSVRDNFLLAQHGVAEYGVARALAYTPGAASVERELRDRAMEGIRALGFERYADTEVRKLSHGQQRLVELGCALVTGPELLLLDEPSAGLSPAATESLAERLRQIRDEMGLTVLLIEHHIPLVLDVCDEIYVLNFGQLLAAGSTEEIARHPEVVGAYFGEAVPA